MLQRLFSFFCLVIALSCKEKKAIPYSAVFPGKIAGIDTLHLTHTGPLLWEIAPLSMHNFPGTDLFIGGSYKTKKLYVMDLRRDIILDSLPLNQTNSYEMYRTNGAIYLYNHTNSSIYTVYFRTKIDTVLVKQINFSLGKNIYVSNYQEKKLLVEKGSSFFMLYSYGVNKSKAPNYLGERIFQSTSGGYPEFGTYPSTYKSKQYIYRGMAYDTGNDTSFFYCFEMLDRLRHYNPVTGHEREFIFSSYEPPVYKKSKAGNLAYKRQYETQVEYNCNLAVFDSCVVVLKQVPKASITGPDNYKLLAFDRNMRPLWQVTGISGVAPYILKEENSFKLFKPSTNEMFTYYL